MSYNLSNDAEPPPGPIPAGISAANLVRVRNGSLALLVALLLILILWWTRSIYTDWLWFEHLGYRSVFTKILILKTWLFLAGALVAGVAIGLNLYLAMRYSMGASTLSIPRDTFRLLWASIVATAAVTVLIVAAVFGTAASGRWETLLLYFNKLSFGVSDAQFGLDTSFYVVTLGLLNFVQGWTLALLITVILASLTLYVAVYSLRGIGFLLAPRLLKHMAVIGLFLMLTIAGGHAINVYELVLSDNGVVFGATYADIHARMPVYWLLTGIAMLAALGFGVSIFFGGLRFMAGAFSLWVIMVLLAGLAYPALFQRFQVQPNEFERERPYILRNITATRAAYQLDQLQVVPFQSTPKLDARAVEQSQSTLDNIRLWDLQPLQDAYNQLQFMELYYNFLNMDWDRYTVNNRKLQVLVAARELNPENLPPDAQNWVNQKLQYTHGFGIAMSPATGFTPGEGRPEFLLQDIPIRGEFPVHRPELYYGESPVEFVIVNSELPEVDPREEAQHYEGDGGVALTSGLRRFAYASQFADVNILLSDQITPDSRIQYRKQIRDRVSTIAPFLKLDRDPYPVLDNAGKLFWLQDAYTVSGRFPYSTPFDERFNYIRNSVKVVVDAYNGSVDFYVIEPGDPLIKMYRNAFPGLFRDFQEIPPDLRDHIRYPIGLFSAQARIYLRYHITEPQVFFNQAEQWAIPSETRFGKRGVRVRSSYLMFRIPGEDQIEFLLMVPFTPAGEKKNLVGWLIARNDWPNYGQLLAFHLPSNPQVDGPSQVEARIENDQQISQQFTLWEGAGSQIIRGQLLVIPIEGTILYVEPLYLQSDFLAFPELKKVILADGTDVVMADSVREALAMLVGDSPAGFPPVSAGTRDESPGLVELDQIQDAVTGLADALDELQNALEDLKETLGGSRR